MDQTRWIRLIMFQPFCQHSKHLEPSRVLGDALCQGQSSMSRPVARGLRTKTFSGAVVVRYGDKSVYFDLEELGNTTGQWDFKFFETFAAPFTKRGLLLKFLILGGGLTLANFSSTATGDILPIKKGPQLPPKLGPRGKI